MPYSPTTEILTLCDKLVATLVASWEPGSPNKAERVYWAPIPLKDLQGRQVWVFPTHYDFGTEDRGEDHLAHDVTVLIARRYENPGPVPTDWIDQEVDWVNVNIVKGFYFTRPPYLAWGTRLVHTIPPVQVDVIDLAKLTTDNLFLATVDFHFEEIQNA